MTDAEVQAAIGAELDRQPKRWWYGLPVAFLTLLSLWCCSGHAQDACREISPQTRPALIWAQTALCTDGSPIAACPPLAYVVERRTPTTDWAVVTGPTGLPAATRTWRDQLLPASEYRYRIRTTHDGAIPAVSNEVCYRVIVPKQSPVPVALKVWGEQL